MLKRLWSAYHQWYIKYSRFSKEDGQDELAYFRNKLFVSILILILPLGVISYIPSAITALILDKPFVFYVDTIAISLIAFLFFNNKMSLNTKKVVFAANLFVLSFALVLHIGLKSSSGLILFMLCVLVTLFSGRKSGVNTTLAAAFVYFLIALSVYFKIFDFKVFQDEQIQVIIIVFVNNILFILMAVFSVSFLVQHLHNALLKENSLQEALVIKHENVIKAKEKAEQSDQLKTAFLANMSHEIRTPMYGILGCADLLKSYNTDDEEFKEYVSIIEGNGQELLDVMTDILNISKIETGLMTLSITNFNVNAVIDSIFTSFLAEAKAKQIKLTLNNFIANKDQMINSDQGKFTDVLKHLMENAIKYTEEGGHIILNCNVNIETSQLNFILNDTGIGVPKDKLESIFNSFYQVDVLNKDALHGSGIGLSISKAFIEMLGGQLELESHYGEGTSFLFEIDMDLKEKAPQSE
ncbi:MAG: ATP-binding protein [Winogradskyella arenosi]